MCGHHAADVLTTSHSGHILHHNRSAIPFLCDLCSRYSESWRLWLCHQCRTWRLGSSVGWEGPHAVKDLPGTLLTWQLYRLQLRGESRQFVQAL